MRRYVLQSSRARLCRFLLAHAQENVWQQRELSLVQQLADAERSIQRGAGMEAELATLRADLRLREQVKHIELVSLLRAMSFTSLQSLLILFVQ